MRIFRALLTLIFLGTTPRLGAEEPRFPNIANQKRLPGGRGFAADFPGDAGINKQAEVLFADDFETGDIGATWDGTSNKKAKC
jgi:hypothetical protein